MTPPGEGQALLPLLFTPAQLGIRRNGQSRALGMVCLLVGRDTVHLKYMHQDQWLSGTWGDVGMNR